MTSHASDPRTRDHGKRVQVRLPQRELVGRSRSADRTPGWSGTPSSLVDRRRLDVSSIGLGSEDYPRRHGLDRFSEFVRLLVQALDDDLGDTASKR